MNKRPKTWKEMGMEEKKLMIVYGVKEPDWALDKMLMRAINQRMIGWDFIGSGYNFKTQERDLEFRSLKDF